MKLLLSKTVTGVHRLDFVNSVPSRVLSTFAVRYVQVVAIGLSDQGSLSGCRPVYITVVGW